MHTGSLQKLRYCKSYADKFIKEKCSVFVKSYMVMYVNTVLVQADLLYITLHHRIFRFYREKENKLSFFIQCYQKNRFGRESVPLSVLKK